MEHKKEEQILEIRSRVRAAPDSKACNEILLDIFKMEDEDALRCLILLCLEPRTTRRKLFLARAWVDGCLKYADYLSLSASSEKQATMLRLRTEMDEWVKQHDKNENC